MRISPLLPCLALIAVAFSSNAAEAPTVRRAHPFFELLCKSRDRTLTDLRVRMLRVEEGDVVAQRMNDRELVDFETHTYVNAIMWKNASEQYMVDRYSGVLTSKGSTAAYDCTVAGGQLF